MPSRLLRQLSRRFLLRVHSVNSPQAPHFWIDGHLDIAYVGLLGRPFGDRMLDPDEGCLTLPDLRDAPVRCALATIFTEARAPGQPAGYHDSDDIEGAHRAGVAQLEWYLEEERLGRVRIIKTREDYEVALADERPDAPLGIVLLMECADPIRSPFEAQWWFDRGVRVVGMSWAYGSRYSGGNSNGGRITPVGRDLVVALDALGVLHDVSHLSGASFDDLCALTAARVVATHSNCGALLEPKERHLTDAQIRTIGERDGMVGLNLFGDFLAESREAMIDDCVAHVARVSQLIGFERCGLGSDLDGGFAPTKLPIGLRHPRHYRELAYALARTGAPRGSVDGFAHGNWSRTLRAALPASLTATSDRRAVQP